MGLQRYLKRLYEIFGLDDLAIETLDDIDEAFFNGDADPQRLKSPTRPQAKRKIIEDYMKERQLKRRLNESFDFIYRAPFIKTRR